MDRQCSLSDFRLFMGISSLCSLKSETIRNLNRILIILIHPPPPSLKLWKILGAQLKSRWHLACLHLQWQREDYCPCPMRRLLPLPNQKITALAQWENHCPCPMRRSLPLPNEKITALAQREDYCPCPKRRLLPLPKEGWTLAGFSTSNASLTSFSHLHTHQGAWEKVANGTGAGLLW